MFCWFFFFYIVLEKTSVSAAEFYHMAYDASLFWCIFSFFFSVVDMGCVHLILSNYSNFLSNKKKTTIETVFEHIYC